MHRIALNALTWGTLAGAIANAAWLSLNGGCAAATPSRPWAILDSIGDPPAHAAQRANSGAATSPARCRDRITTRAERLR